MWTDLAASQLVVVVSVGSWGIYGLPTVRKDRSLRQCEKWARGKKEELRDPRQGTVAIIQTGNDDNLK